MSRYNLAWLIAVPMALLTGVVLTVAAPNRVRDKDYQLVRTIVDVLAEVDQHYVRKLSDEQKQKLVEDMINGGLERLDPYSQYLNADEHRQFNAQTEGNFGGVGIQLGVDPKTGLPLVISPMVGTPAYEAGVLPGDLIVKVDDKAMDPARPNDVIRLILGEPGTKVSLTVIHEGNRQSESFTLTRAKIEVPTVLGLNRLPDNPKEFEWFADRKAGIAYIRLVQFGEHSADDLKKAIERLEKEGLKSLILDLRDNPGGLLKSAIQISDQFLTSGAIVSTRDRNGNGPSADAKGPGTLLEPAADHPMVVLVNRNSASASEIVAAALQDHKRAVVIGERSFGKGSVQKVIRLGNDQQAALKLTTDTYWRPSGKNIHRHPDAKESDEWGVKPNEGFEITMKDDERLAYLRHRRNKDIIRKEKKEDVPFTDRALEKAIEHLRSATAK